jgi:hypothetical protein
MSGIAFHVGRVLAALEGELPEAPHGSRATGPELAKARVAFLRAIEDRDPAHETDPVLERTRRAYLQALGVAPW